MTKYLVEKGTAATVGWDSDKTVYETKEEAEKAFNDAVEEYIKDVVSDNAMSEVEEAEYRAEVEDEADSNPEADASKHDPDYEWYVDLYIVKKA